MKAEKLSSSLIVDSRQKRFKPLAYLHEGQSTYRQLLLNDAIQSNIGGFRCDVFRPGIFKRNFVYKTESGLPYIPAAAMMMTNPYPASKLLSKKYTDNLEPMILHEGMILINVSSI